MNAVNYEIWTHDSLDQEFSTFEMVQTHFNESYYGYGKIEELDPENDRGLIEQGFKWQVLWYKGSGSENPCLEDFSLIKPIYTCDEPSEEDPDVLAERLYNYQD